MMSTTEWRRYDAVELPPISVHLSPSGAAVLRCHACDWGYTVDRAVAAETVLEHAAEHAARYGRVHTEDGNE